MSDTPPITTDEDRLRHFVSLCSNGEFDLASTTYLSPEVTLHEPAVLPYGGDLQGLEGWTYFRTNFHATWKRWVDGPIWYAESGGTVIKENVISAISRKTGKSYSTRLAEIFTFQDGKIVDIRVYYHDIPGFLAAHTPEPSDLVNVPTE